MESVSLFINQFVRFMDEHSGKSVCVRVFFFRFWWKSFGASVTSVVIRLINKKTFTISVNINQHDPLDANMPTSNSMKYFHAGIRYGLSQICCLFQYWQHSFRFQTYSFQIDDSILLRFFKHKLRLVTLIDTKSSNQQFASSFHFPEGELLTHESTWLHPTHHFEFMADSFYEIHYFLIYIQSRIPWSVSINDFGCRLTLSNQLLILL